MKIHSLRFIVLALTCFSSSVYSIQWFCCFKKSSDHNNNTVHLLDYAADSEGYSTQQHWKARYLKHLRFESVEKFVIGNVIIAMNIGAVFWQNFASLDSQICSEPDGTSIDCSVLRQPNTTNVPTILRTETTCTNESFGAGLFLHGLPIGLGLGYIALSYAYGKAYKKTVSDSEY